jgi:hypothetical protein
MRAARSFRATWGPSCNAGRTNHSLLVTTQRGALSVTATWRAIAAAAPPRLIDLVSRRYEGRRVDLAADTYYASAALAGLPARVTVWVSLRRDTALYASAPSRTGRPGRPCKQGHLLPSLAQLATRGGCERNTLERFGKTTMVETLPIDCL